RGCGGDQRLRHREGARPGRRLEAPGGRRRELRAKRHLDASNERLPRERAEPRPASPVRLPHRPDPRAHRTGPRWLARHRPGRTATRGGEMTKVEAVVLRERVEIVIDAVEEQTGHVGVTVVEAVGHGRERGITHEYRGRVFESRFLPKALLIFI